MTPSEGVAFVSSLPLAPRWCCNLHKRCPLTPISAPPAPLLSPRATSPRRPRSVYRTAPSARASDSPAPRASPFAALLGVCAVVSALPALLVMAVLHPLVLLRDGARRGAHAALARAWLRVAFGLAGVKVRVSGSEKLPPRGSAALFVANCQSPLDMFAVAAVRRPARFVVPAAALKAPVIGWVMSLAQWVGVGGADRRAQMKALKDATGVLQDGASLCMFPEGAPSKDGRIGKFSPAPFRAAKKAGVPVVPVTIKGTGEMFVGEGKAGVVPSRRPSGPIEVILHSPIGPSEGSDKELAEMACEAVRSALDGDSK